MKVSKLQIALCRKRLRQNGVYSRLLVCEVCVAGGHERRVCVPFCLICVKKPGGYLRRLQTEVIYLSGEVEMGTNCMGSRLFLFL